MADESAGLRPAEMLDAAGGGRLGYCAGRDGRRMLPEHRLFHAQQAVEKALKGVHGVAGAALPAHAQHRPF